MGNGLTRELLENLYREYNRPEFIHPDPLEFIYKYKSDEDREIVGLIAAVLAYGNVEQINRSVDNALSRMSESPRGFIENVREEGLRKYFSGFKHRFTTGEQLAKLIHGVKNTINRHGSLRKGFSSYVSPSDETYMHALACWTEDMLVYFDNNASYLFPSPSRGSACKRSNLFLKWMIRCDDVDPGVWKGFAPAKLVMPVDTHIYRISKKIGLTDRNNVDLKTALEITEGFRRFSPDDPTKYDFAITRLGIRDDCDPTDFMRSCLI